MRKHYASIIFTQSDTIAGQISKSNTFMQSAIGLFDSYIANIDLLNSISGDPIFEFLNPRCGLMTSLQRVISTVSLQNQLLPVVSGDVSGMETDPLEPALYYYHADHLGSAMVVFSPFPLRELVPPFRRGTSWHNFCSIFRMERYGATNSGWVTTSATNTPARKGTWRLGTTTSEQGITPRL